MMTSLWRHIQTAFEERDYGFCSGWKFGEKSSRFRESKKFFWKSDFQIASKALSIKAQHSSLQLKLPLNSNQTSDSRKMSHKDESIDFEKKKRTLWRWILNKVLWSRPLCRSSFCIVRTRGSPRARTIWNDRIRIRITDNTFVMLISKTVHLKKELHSKSWTKFKFHNLFQ